MTDSNERLTQIESLLQQFVAASTQSKAESDERMRRIEQRLEHSATESDERMRRIEQSAIESNARLTRIEQIVESNNRFLESFSRDLRQYTETMHNLATRMGGIIASANQDRHETNSRLSAIQRQTGTIAKHLGVEGSDRA